MWSRLLASGAVVLFLFSTGAVAGDKDVKATLVKVDAKEMVLTVKVGGDTKKYDVNDKTKFIGPKGGVSDKGINDERLVAGVQLRLVVAANNRTLHEVHIPERKAK
jgi:hypothetical protein